MLPFRVGQIARVTQLVTVVERAVFGGPHAGSRGCSPTGTHSGVEPVKRISPPPITDPNDSQSLRTDTDAARAGWRAAGRLRQRPSGGAAEAGWAAGSSPPAADDQALRVPGRGNPA